MLLFSSGVCVCGGGGGGVGGRGGVLSASNIYAYGWLCVSSVYQLLEKMPMPVVEFSEEF